MTSLNISEKEHSKNEETNLTSVLKDNDYSIKEINNAWQKDGKEQTNRT